MKVVVPDVASEADLDQALEATLADAPVLLVGAAGLAAALARRLVPGAIERHVERLTPPLMLAIGARDPITLAQLEALRAAVELPELLAPDGLVAERSLEGEALLVQMVPGTTILEPGEAGARFARCVAGLAVRSRVGTLFACGGETADAILGALGVGVLDVEGQLLPGVPVSRMTAGGEAMRLVTKSGGFGGANALICVVEAARRGGQDAR